MMNCTFLSLKKLIIFLLLEAFLVIIFYCFLRKQNAKLQNNYELSSSRTYLLQSEVNMELYLWFIKYLYLWCLILKKEIIYVAKA